MDNRQSAMGEIAVGVFTLLAVWLTHLLQRRSVEGEAELRRKEMIYEKQLEACEGAIESLTSLDDELGSLIAVYEKLSVADESSVEGEALVREREMVLDTVMKRYTETLETRARISTYLPSATIEAYVAYLMHGMVEMKNMRVEEGIDFRLVRERIEGIYKSTLIKIREPLGIQENILPTQGTTGWRVRLGRRLKN